MSAIEVKICGLTNIDDAKVAVDAGADYLGFVFYQKSPRAVSAKRVADIVSALGDGIRAVGVFVNETPERGQCPCARMWALCRADSWGRAARRFFHGYRSSMARHLDSGS